MGEPGDCLSEDAAFDYVRGSADTELDLTVQAHLDACAACRMMIGEAARTLVSDADSGRGRSGPPLTLNLGDVVAERYEIVRFVARGGMGEVYEARDRVLGELVALKTLVCTALDNPHAISRLLAEVRLARHVTHPNVCRIFELGFHRAAQKQEAVPFLTMEFLAGDSLDRRIAAQGRLAPGYVGELLGQLCAGLAAIHAAGIVHRDIKPHNVMLLPGSPERLVLTDFGLARALDTERQGSSFTGAIAVGTIEYMAPEQLEGKPATRAFDVYALGIVLFEMLTGEKPFTGETPLAGALARLQTDAPPPSSRVPGLPRSWDALVARCLARDPAARFARVEDIVAPAPADDAATDAAPAPATPAPPAAIVAPPLSPPRRARRWMLGGAAALVLLVAALAQIPRERSSPSRPPLLASAPSRAIGATGCSSDMVRVADGFCIDRFEAGTVDDQQQRPLSPYYPPSAPELRRVAADWSAKLAAGSAGNAMPLPPLLSWQRQGEWQARAVSRAGVVPQAYTSLDAARAACASAGKRLCSADEWRTACRGEARSKHPYGDSYRDDVCNVHGAHHPGLLLHRDRTTGLLDPRLNQVSVDGAPLLHTTGARADCKSVWGDDAVFDLVGNLEEWVEAPVPTYMGGFFARATRDGCDAKIDKHGPTHFDHTTGFRCCDQLRSLG